MKQEVNYKKKMKNYKYGEIKQHVTENTTGSQIKIKKYLEANDRRNMTYQYLWDATEAVVRKKEAQHKK